MTTDATISREHLEANSADFSAWRLGTLAGLQRLNAASHALAFPATCTTHVAWTAPKMVEAKRQIERLHIAKTFAERRSSPNDDIEGLTACMSLLGHFAVGPIPVPVASWTADEGPSLFLQTDKFYGDLEVEGDQIEYMLRWTQDGAEIEVFDTETVNEGRVPPRLLAHLFRAFAKHDAEVL